MKLLLDENLSPSLVMALAGMFDAVRHVRDVGLRGSSDAAVWEFAKSGGFCILTKDLDFYRRSLAEGQPPKVIWVLVGNAPTIVVFRLLAARLVLIQGFWSDDRASFLVLRPD